MNLTPEQQRLYFGTSIEFVTAETPLYYGSKEGPVLTAKDLYAAYIRDCNRVGKHQQRIDSIDEYNKLARELKMSEENKEVQPQPEISLGPKAESISKTVIKKLRALTKDQLVEKIVALSNYAEEMKAANMILLYQTKQLNEKLNGTSQEAQAVETPTDKEVTNENV